MARQHHAGDAGALGAAQQGAQVAGIGDPGRHKEERLYALTARGTQFLQRHRLDRPGQRQHALRRFGPRLRIQTMPRHRLDRDTEPGRQLFYAVQLRRGILVLGQEDLAYRAAPHRKQLQHGPPALHLIASQLAGLALIRTMRTRPAAVSPTRTAPGASGAPGTTPAVPRPPPAPPAPPAPPGRLGAPRGGLTPVP